MPRTQPPTQPPKKTQPQPIGRRPVPKPTPQPIPMPPPTYTPPSGRRWKRPIPPPGPGWGPPWPKPAPSTPPSRGSRGRSNAPELPYQRPATYSNRAMAEGAMEWVLPPPDPGERLRRIAALKAGRGPQRATGGIATPGGMLAKGGAVKPKLTKAQGAKASAKISHLHKTEPKMPHKQMVGMAMNMAREGRLGSKGGYKPKKAGRRAKKG